MNAERYLVILPTFNEADNVPRIVPEILRQDERIEVLVVDDASPDGTGELAESMAAENERVHALRRTGPRSFALAYLDGFRWGLERDYALFIQMDADLSHPPDCLPQFIEKSRDHDLVVGSRYYGGRIRVVNWPVWRLFLSCCATVYARVVTGLPLSDATGGFNCYRRDVVDELMHDRIQSNGYAFLIELKYRSWKRGFRIAELPFVFTERDSGESKMSGSIMREAAWKLWKLRFLSMFGRLSNKPRPTEGDKGSRT